MAALNFAEIKEKLVSKEYELVFENNKKKQRSSVWNTFGRIKNGNNIFENIVACRHCYHILKYSGSTTNLLSHVCAKRKRY
jgi:hypothetical protein